MAQAGEGMVVAGQIAVKSVTAGFCVVNALGIVNRLTNIIVKIVNEEDTSAFDLFQFTSCVLFFFFFFTNPVISAHQAYTLINRLRRVVQEMISYSVL
jgi:hypothetical protein